MNDSMFALVVAKWQFAFEGLKETKNNAFLSVAGSLVKTMVMFFLFVCAHVCAQCICVCVFALRVCYQLLNLI